MPVNVSSLRQTLFHRVTAPPSQVQSDLEQLRNFDRRVEQRLARITTLIPWAIGLGVLILFLSAALLNFILSHPGFLAGFPAELVVFLLVGFTLGSITCWVLPYITKNIDSRYLSKLANQFLILALASAGLLLLLQFPLVFLNPFTVIVLVIIFLTTLFVMRGQTVALNLPNYRYDLAERILALLSRDMDVASRISLKLLFKKQVDQPVKTIPFTRRPDWKIDFCDNEWLKIKGPLLNGYWLQLSLTERYRKRYGRNINGKLREKFQQRGLEIKLGIRISRQGHRDLNSLRGQIEQMVRLPASATLKQLTLSEDLLKMKVLVPHWLGGARSISLIWPQDPSEDAIRQVQQVIMMMLLSAFQILNFAHVLSRRTAA